MTASTALPEWRTHDCKRNDTTSLFAAFDVATGSVIGKCYRCHRARELLDFLEVIDRNVADGLDIHVVMGNYATHKTAGARLGWRSGRPGTPTSRRHRRKRCLPDNVRVFGLEPGIANALRTITGYDGEGSWSRKSCIWTTAN